uniref:Uncharacterized protein n=1 Tax=Anguilla anguilla TaxID=7936 RepID=A0A0E9UWQ0_ANGAN
MADSIRHHFYFRRYTIAFSDHGTAHDTSTKLINH